MVRFYVHFETHENHLFKFSPDWQLLKKKPLPANIPFGFFGNQTIEDQAGNLWIGATNGNLLRFNPKTETFEVFSYQALMPQSGSEIETYTLHKDESGTLFRQAQTPTGALQYSEGVCFECCLKTVVKQAGEPKPVDRPGRRWLGFHWLRLVPAIGEKARVYSKKGN